MMDCNSVYWQIEVVLEDRYKRAFVPHHGLYQYVHILYGLKNAPETFNRSIDMILFSIRWQYAIMYLDVIIIFSRNVD